MKICSNCGVQLSCGCQRKEAFDGTLCCDQCINAYEAKQKTPAPIPMPESAPKAVIAKKTFTGKEPTNDE